MDDTDPVLMGLERESKENEKGIEQVRKWEKQQRGRDKDGELESEWERESAIKERIWAHWRKQKEEVKNIGDPLQEICRGANSKAELNSEVRVGIGEMYLMPVIFN